MPKKITCVSSQLYYHLIDCGGSSRSLRAMCADLGIDYHHAWECLNALERAGLVTITRRARQPLVMTTDTNRLEKFLQALLASVDLSPYGGPVLPYSRRVTRDAS